MPKLDTEPTFATEFGRRKYKEYEAMSNAEFFRVFVLEWDALRELFGFYRKGNKDNGK